jgi:hypothetical protein
MRLDAMAKSAGRGRCRLIHPTSIIKSIPVSLTLITAQALSSERHFGTTRRCHCNLATLEDRSVFLKLKLSLCGPITTQQSPGAQEPPDRPEMA